MRQISAAEANRHFSKLLREVQGGESVTVTSHGRPVAVLQPPHPESSLERQRARAQLLSHLSAQEPLGLSFSRDELYDDDV